MLPRFGFESDVEIQVLEDSESKLELFQVHSLNSIFFELGIVPRFESLKISFGNDKKIDESSESFWSESLSFLFKKEKMLASRVVIKDFEWRYLILQM